MNNSLKVQYTSVSIGCTPILNVVLFVVSYAWRIELERRLEGQQFTKLGRKFQHNWPYFQSINLINTCRKVPLQVNFLDDDISHFCLYSYLVNEEKRRLEGQQFTKLGRKFQHDWLYLQSINLINTCRKVPLQVSFLDDDISHFCLYSYLVNDGALDIMSL